MELSDVIKAILDGELDEGRERIGAAFRQRESVKAAMLGADLSPGDRVRFKVGKVRPKYLEGVEATVAKVNQTTANITLDDATGRFSGERETRAPLSSLEKVPA